MNIKKERYKFSEIAHVRMEQQDQGMTELEIPLRSGTDAFMISVWNAISMFDNSVQAMTSPTDIRPYIHARSIIMRIPDDTIRLKLFEKLDSLIESIEPKQGADAKGEQRLKICQVMIGEAVAFFDEHVGISHKQLISDV